MLWLDGGVEGQGGKGGKMLVDGSSRRWGLMCGEKKQDMSQVPRLSGQPCRPHAFSRCQSKHG